jgi:branched-chain amino acid transport system substrate-binding protein
MSDAFVRLYNHAPSQFAIDGYVAVQLIAGAIRQAGSDRPEAIRQSLNRLRQVTPQGEYQFSQDNHSGLRLEDVAITEVAGGQFRLTTWSQEQLAR